MVSHVSSAGLSAVRSAASLALKIEGTVDSLLTTAAEGGKSVVREVFVQAGRTANGFSATLLHVVDGQKSYYSSRRQRIIEVGQTNSRQVPVQQDAGPLSASSSIRTAPHHSSRKSLSRYGKLLATGDEEGSGMSVSESDSDMDTLSRASSAIREDEIQVQYLSTAPRHSRLHRWSTFLFRVAVNILVSAWLLITLWIPLFGCRRKKSPPQAGLSRSMGIQRTGSTDRLHQDEERTTGLFEDLQINIILLIDRVSKALRRYVKQGIRTVTRCTRTTEEFLEERDGTHYRKRSSSSNRRHSGGKPASNKKVSRLERLIAKVISLDIDEVLTEDKVREAGYPFERHSVPTEDGYIISLERIPNKLSRRAIFLQHGVCDSSFAWVGLGPTGSLAFQLAERGFDVWMGNFRGTEPCAHVKGNLGTKYWAFCIDELAGYDIPAFVHCIQTTKASELGSLNCTSDGAEEDTSFGLKGNGEPSTDVSPRFTITAVGHSLGGCSLMAYAVDRGRKKLPIVFNKMIVMAPAGCHPEIPTFCKITGPIIMNTLGRLFGNFAFKFPSDLVVRIVTKLMRDFRNGEATMDLLQFMAAGFLGGDRKDFPLAYIHNLTYNSLNSGPSMKLFRQFWNIWKKQKFLAYDYGRDENLRRYGQAEPPDYLDDYHLIDVPVHVVVGLDDKLIPPKCVLTHYHKLQQVKPDLANVKFFDVGHLAFTYEPIPDLLSYVLKVVGTKMPKRK